MKKHIFTLFFLSYFICFSQSEKNFDYDTYSDPNPKNKLSLYFKSKINKKLLKNVRFFKNKNNVTLSFFINEQGEPYRLNVASYGSKEYYDTIKETFKSYFSQNFTADSLDSKNRYFLQIISKKGRRNIFNCSSKLIVEKPPICKECKDLKLYEDIKTCLNLEVKKHFYKNADFSILDKLKDEEIDIFIQFSVTKSGELKYTKKSRLPVRFLYETDRVLSSFPKIQQVSTKNNLVIEPKHSFSFQFKKGETPKLIDQKNEFNLLYKPSQDNKLSQFFIKNLTNKDLKKSNLSRIKNHLSLYFELNKDLKPINLRTNSRSNSLEKTIIELFKKYPFSQLNFHKKDLLNGYIIQILDFRDHQTFVNTNSIVESVKHAIYPGCEASENIKAAKKCFSKKIQMHFSTKFDSSLPKKLKLDPGRKRILIKFKINIDGDIVDINVDAPHQKITQEVIRVMRKLPKVQPAIRRGKPIKTKFTIPFTIIVK